MSLDRRSALHLAVGAAILLSGCGIPFAPVTYEGHEQSPTVESIGANRYRIYAEGNDRNRQIEIEAFGLTKAAEITLSKAQTHFKVLDSKLRAVSGQEPAYTFRLDIETLAAADVPADGKGYLDAERIAAQLGPIARSVQ